jgi:hypothetical protein
MKEYLHPNGFKYTEEELRGYAKQENLSFNEYLSAKNFKPVTVPGAKEIGGGIRQSSDIEKRMIEMEKQDVPLQTDMTREQAMDVLKNPDFSDPNFKDNLFSRGVRTAYSWMPEWLVGWSTQLANQTMEMGIGITETIDSEKLAEGLREGKTKEELIEEGVIFDTRAFDMVQGELNQFARKEYDKETGEELDVISLIERGRIGDAGGLAGEQAGLEVLLD